MRPSAFIARFPALRPSAAASILALLVGTAAVQAAPDTPAPSFAPAIHQTSAAIEDGAILKRLPASKGELTFRGENATRSFKLALSRTEAARTSAFQIGLLNAVSILPDRSTVRIAINGTVLAAIPAASVEKLSVQSIKIPTGVLVPGINTVQVSVALSHRVDCSINATYELWALLDPAKTGFVIPREATFGARSIDELAFEPLAEDGATHIRLRLDANASPADIAQAGQLIDVLARRAYLPRPIVEVGPEMGEGAGFDLVIDRRTGEGAGAGAGGLKVMGRDDNAILARDPATNRLVVIVPGTDRADLDRRILALSKSPTAQNVRAGGAAIDGGSRVKLSDLGFAPESFTGRHYLSSVAVELPADFYPANDRAQLFIDGAHSASLAEGSELVFRVNGTLVSTLPLAAGKAERFSHEIIDLPLRFFHPGHNQLSIEGMTSSPSDQQCDLAAMPREPRLTISGTSAFDLPDFARLATLPRIPAALAYDSAPDGGSVHLYLTDDDRGSIGAGLTVLANMAVTQAGVGAPIVHIGAPASTDAPGLVIGPADHLSEAMAAPLRVLSRPVAILPEDEASAGSPDGAATAPPAPAERPFANDALFGIQTQSIAAAAEAALRSRGFFFTSETRTDLLPATATSILVAALAPESFGRSVDGIELPQFLREPAHWLVFTGASAETTQTGVRSLVANGHWTELGGQAASLDVRTDDFHTVQPAHLAYVVPSRIVLSDIRPILGGIVSNNIVLSIGFMLVLMSILGLSTHVLIRRMGAK